MSNWSASCVKLSEVIQPLRHAVPAPGSQPPQTLRFAEAVATILSPAATSIAVSKPKPLFA
jgi:hypothetical protein